MKYKYIIIKSLLVLSILFIFSCSNNDDEKVKEKKVAKYIMENIQKDYLDIIRNTYFKKTINHFLNLVFHLSLLKY